MDSMNPAERERTLMHFYTLLDKTKLTLETRMDTIIQGEITEDINNLLLEVILSSTILLKHSKLSFPNPPASINENYLTTTLPRKNDANDATNSTSSFS